MADELAVETVADIVGVWTELAAVKGIFGSFGKGRGGAWGHEEEVCEGRVTCDEEQ